MQRKIARHIPILAVLALALGCQSFNVQTQHAPGIDFSAYKTFSQAPPPATAANIPGYSSIMGDQIQASIAQTLEAKGFSAATSGAGDMVVAINITGQPRQDVNSAGGYGWYGGGDTYTVNYTEGTLTIDIFDAQKKKLVWHGYGQTQLYGRNSAKNAGKQVDAAVAAILKDFPPQPKN